MTHRLINTARRAKPGTYFANLNAAQRRRHFELAGARLYRTGGPEYRRVTGPRKIIAASSVMTKADAIAMMWGWEGQRDKERAARRG